MKPIQYTIHQSLIAYSLLIGLFLQGCNPNYSLELEPQTTNTKIHQQKQDHSLTVEEEDSKELHQPTHYNSYTGLSEASTQVTLQAEDLAYIEQQEPQPTPQSQSRISRFTVKPLAGDLVDAPQQSIRNKNKPQQIIPKMFVNEQQALSRSQAISKQEKQKESCPTKQESSNQQVIQTKPGQTVTLYQKAETWKARVEERYGSLHRTQVLPVYPQELSLSTRLNPTQIHYIKGTHGKNAIYVGSLGLPGGMISMLQNHPSNQEIILFCGNPGVGKSALCNSIFGEIKFQSGLHATGLTQSHQSHTFENKLYIDTPGLADEKRQKEAAREIEEALKKNGDYKIIFVSTLEAARIKPQDIATINAVCDSISSSFEYGLLINKVTDNAMKMVTEDIEAYLSCLKKRPSVWGIIKKDGSIEDAENVFITNSEARGVLIDFISLLPANRIRTEDVKPIDVTDYKKKTEEIQQDLNKTLSELQASRSTNEELRRRQTTSKAAQIITITSTVVGGLVGGVPGAAIGNALGNAYGKFLNF